jgi:hypothetical protein
MRLCYYFLLQPFYTREEFSQYVLGIGGWVDTRNGLDVVVKRHIAGS